MKLRGIKELVIMGALFLVLFLLWASSSFGMFDKDYYLSTKVLEKTVPFNVTIDLDQFRPAYEQ